MSSTTIAILAFALVTILIPSGMAIRCWTCSSDLDPRCGDTFNTTVPYGSHGYSLTDCNAQSSGGSYPYITSARSVCKKSKQLVNGDMTIIRSCAWQMPDQPVGTCTTTPSSQQIRVVFCETCETEGCNSGHGLTAIPLLAALSTASVIYSAVKYL
ncbi:UPAR/Ly6 domain-containing protein crok-like [Arctopsyche grandis]|uniref:UPAR/Ly6 domain-containing protein crok-like n=1 Tax=Arctopsyche grandis TaxID=121162 RepID=UPI00406D972F